VACYIRTNTAAAQVEVARALMASRVPFVYSIVANPPGIIIDDAWGRIARAAIGRVLSEQDFRLQFTM
jgi:hypothetical protein